MISGNNSKGGGRHGAFFLGTYDAQEEVMHVDFSRGPQLLESGSVYHWSVAGDAGAGADDGPAASAVLSSTKIVVAARPACL